MLVGISKPILVLRFCEYYLAYARDLALNQKYRSAQIAAGSTIDEIALLLKG